MSGNPETDYSDYSDEEDFSYYDKYNAKIRLDTISNKDQTKHTKVLSTLIRSRDVPNDLLVSFLKIAIDEHIDQINLELLLLMACYVGHENTIKFLVERGANINAKSYLGSTPIMFLAQRGNSEMVKYFIDKGADLKIINIYNSDLYYFAKESNDSKTIEIAEKYATKKKPIKPIDIFQLVEEFKQKNEELAKKNEELITELTKLQNTVPDCTNQAETKQTQHKEKKVEKYVEFFNKIFPAPPSIKEENKNEPEMDVFDKLLKEVSELEKSMVKKS